jgi:electron transport complex protein RnfD
MNTAKHPDLLLTTSPFVKDKADTKWIMWQVNFALIPVVLAATWYFGLAALLIIAAASAGALMMEAVVLNLSPKYPGNLRDGSAFLTGLLLALTLPPGTPLWIAFAGGVISIGLGKAVFGGLGGNMFNPALVGRAFLQATFPVAITTWPTVLQADRFLSPPSSLFAWPFMTPEVDAVTSATPLSAYYFDGVTTGFKDLMLGSTAGSLGETAGVLILICGVYLAVRNVINWRIPVSILGTVVVFAALLHWMNPESYPGADFHLFAGGLLLGAVYMATDPVTSPLTQKGCWIFGVGIGILVVVIRQFGGLPEGVMYAILLMNAVSPLIDRSTQARTFGSVRPERFTR